MRDQSKNTMMADTAFSEYQMTLSSKAMEKRMKLEEIRKEEKLFTNKIASTLKVKQMGL